MLEGKVTLGELRYLTLDDVDVMCDALNAWQDAAPRPEDT